ncbi:MAG TPA: FAD-dependent thymidylate synthase [Candidatus Polarisedimenticolia bacterium]|nr:FAD-dependent thymidylate synthase [Candidatus Polarisedimenticolia bacterium]
MNKTGNETGNDTGFPLERPHVAALDAILGKPFRVLDDGFVRVVDYMGADESIVQAARVSYGAGTKRIHEDRGLIRYLLRHRHTTPFEMCEIKLHVRVPMDCWRQWIRHRTASVNEYSTRYSVAIDAAQKTEAGEWRLQSQKNRQGSDEFLETPRGTAFTKKEEDLHELSRKLYEERLAAGIAREQARKDLPLSTYTEAYWKTNLHNLLHFLKLRMDMHAQEEIRTYADVIGSEIVAKWCPITWEAFLDYSVNALELSATESRVIAAIGAKDTAKAAEIARAAGMLNMVEGRLAKNRERDELEAKLRQLNLRVPWES